MKEFLSRGGHRFTVRNVDEDDAAYDELLGRGFMAVPVTIIGDRTIQGFDEAKLKEALARVSG